MVQRGGGLCFLTSALRDLAGLDVLTKNLQRNAAAEAGILGEIDLARPRRAQREWHGPTVVPVASSIRGKNAYPTADAGVCKTSPTCASAAQCRDYWMVARQFWTTDRRIIGIQQHVHEETRHPIGDMLFLC
jgi:hypothetical protein